MRRLGRSWLCGLIAAAALATVPALAAASFTAYNDCYRVGTETLATNVTTIQMTGTGSTGSLKDITSGANVATLTISYGPTSGAPVLANDPVWGGNDCAPGTDAYTTFNGLLNMHGQVQYGSNMAWYVDYTFSGLDPSKTYNVVGVANRYQPGGGNPTAETTANYTVRQSDIIISGADSFINAPSSQDSLVAGVAKPTIKTTTVANDTAVICFALNYTNGYVSKFTNINPGSDGTFNLRVQADNQTGPDAYKAYSFGALQLVETPEPATLSLLAIGGLLALRRRSHR